MDITQIPLKINQTTQSEGGKMNGESTPKNSFLDILFEQFLNSDGPLPSKNELNVEFQQISDASVDINIDIQQLNEEEWREFDSIIMAVLTVINELKSVVGTANGTMNSMMLDQQDTSVMNSVQNSSKNLLEFDSSTMEAMKVMKELQGLNATSAEQTNSQQTDGSKTSVMNYFSILQHEMVEILNDLGQWLQKIKGQSHSSTVDFHQVVKDLSQFLSKEPMKANDVPDYVKNNIQHLLTELDVQSRDFNVERKMLLSLDKQQMLGLAKPMMEFTEDNRQVKIQMSEGREAGPAPSENQALSNQPIKLQVGINQPQPISTLPALSVSAFPMEMNEWIGRNLLMHKGSAGSADARFLLNPEHLGPIEIKISFDEQGQISARILTDTLTAKETLEGQLQQLRQNLQQQGLLVQRLDVVQQGQILDSNQAGVTFQDNGSSFSQEHPNHQTNEEHSKNRNEADQQELEKEPAAFTYGSASPKTASQIDFSA